MGGTLAARAPVEGFFIELVDGSIFEVKGLVHPPGRLVAYPRYVPDPTGDRVLGDGRAYRKVATWAERAELLRGPYRSYVLHDPVLDEELCEPPLSHVARVLDPVRALEGLRYSGDLSGLAYLAVEMAEAIVERAGISWSDVGISGSLLAGLEGPKSDIDLVFYGLSLIHI